MSLSLRPRQKQNCYDRSLNITTLVQKICDISCWEPSAFSLPGDDVELSSLEIGSSLFLLIYATTMLIDRNGDFTMSETNVSQTGGNV